MTLSLCLRPPNNVAEDNLRSSSYAGCKEKRAGRAKFVVFHLLIGLIAVAVAVAFVVAPRIYRCEYTVRNPSTFSVKTPAIFSLGIYVIQDSAH